MVQKGISSIAIILIIVGVLVVAGGIWYWQKSKVYFPPPLICEQKTKVCPDGTIVSRIGQESCGEFAPCPDETADWKTYRNEEYGFEVKYPKDLTFRVSADERKLSNRGENCLSADKCFFVASFENLPFGISNFRFSINDVPVNEEPDFNTLTERPKPDIVAVGPLKIEKYTYLGIKNDYEDNIYAVWYYPIGASSTTAKDIFSLETSSSQNQRDSVFALFDQILSTFKFIK